MRIERRQFLKLAGAAAAPLLPEFARSQTYPPRPVRLIVGFAGGRGADAVELTASASPAFEQASMIEVESASELPIWRTITVGLHSGVNAVRNAFDDAKIALGDSADEILGRPTFAFTKERRQLDLVALSVAALGFGAEGGTLADIHARAIRFGFELCPEEVGPHLRLQYLNQPVGEFLHVAMKPQRTYGGGLVDFTLANSGTGLSMLGGSARPDLVLSRNVVFVFVRPSPAHVATVPGL